MTPRSAVRKVFELGGLECGLDSRENALDRLVIPDHHYRSAVTERYELPARAHSSHLSILPFGDEWALMQEMAYHANGYTDIGDVVPAIRIAPAFGSKGHQIAARALP